MPIKKGDRITIGIAPTVQLAAYSYVKPSASITRDIVSGDEEGIKVEVEQIAKDLERLIFRATLTELGLSNDLHHAVAEGTEGLAEFCRKELGYEPETQSHATPGRSAPAPAAPGKGDPAAADRPRPKVGAGPVRKGPVRKSG